MYIYEYVDSIEILNKFTREMYASIHLYREVRIIQTYIEQCFSIVNIIRQNVFNIFCV